MGAEGAAQRAGGLKLAASDFSSCTNPCEVHERPTRTLCSLRRINFQVLDDY